MIAQMILQISLGVNYASIHALRAGEGHCKSVSEAGMSRILRTWMGDAVAMELFKDETCKEINLHD